MTTPAEPPVHLPLERRRHICSAPAQSPLIIDDQKDHRLSAELRTTRERETVTARRVHLRLQRSPLCRRPLRLSALQDLPPTSGHVEPRADEGVIERREGRAPP